MAQPLSVMEIHKLAKKSHWSIRLGQPEWSKFTYQRPVDDPLKLLGSARHGHQYGALAKLEDELVLVVGDYVTALGKSDQKQLADLLGNAKIPDELPVYQPPRPREGPPPVVIIKRRRIPVLPVPAASRD